MSEKKLLGGLDIGTTGCKLSVYREDGEFVYNKYIEYEVSRHGGAHEVDAEMIFAAVCEVIGEVCSQYEVSAIGVTSFGETFVALDKDDNALLHAMLYTDPRGLEECRMLCDMLGEERITEISGAKPHAMYSIAKIMWLKNNMPEVWAKVARITLVVDYVIYRLTGTAQIDYSLAARTGALDIRNKCWSKEIFDAAGVDTALMSKPVPSGTTAGSIKPALAEKLGILGEVKMVTVSHDQVASAVGAGILTSGEAVDGTGTVECITPMFDSIPENKDLYKDNYAVVPYVFDGTYVCYAFSFTGGATLKWFRDNFAGKFEGAENIYAELDKAIPADPTGLLILPHFAGAATPYMDNGSRAAILGLTLETTAEDIYKALMEGVTYEIMLNLERLAAAGIVPEQLYATGGGARSDVWLQIKADITNRPVTAMCAKEVGAAGSCMLAGTATGLYADLHEAAKVFVKERITYKPDPEKAAQYTRYYNAYRSLYNAVRPIVEEAGL
ncbi:MAG: carbohydrate kinase [Ruminococcaceae bacterium]|nr:carbohydrate kinase [Oscillospiraceae bacterium]